MGKKAHFKLIAYNYWSNKEIDRFDSVKEVSETLNIPEPNIYRNLQGRSRQTWDTYFKKVEK